MSKRIHGIGSIRGSSITLTRSATRAAGHLAPEGVTVDTETARAMRSRIADAAEALAAETGRAVEVYASARRRQPWTVDVVEPRKAA